MITSHIKGGIGNVMFQVAAGYGLAARMRTGVAFDIFNPETINQRRIYHGTTNYTYADNILRNVKDHRFDPSVSWKIVNENHIDPRAKNLAKLTTSAYDCKLSGYFQSDIYFKHIDVEIRELYSIPEYIEKYITSKYGNILKGTESVSLHVRRGDYLQLKDSHPLCSIKYYTTAVEKLVNNNSKVLIFSDDLEWCKQQFKGDLYTYINEPDYICIYMMSMCDHNIIANSSFSWWGAWLNLSKDKRVVAPRPWLGDKHKQDSEWWDKNVYCDTWEVLNG